MANLSRRNVLPVAAAALASAAVIPAVAAQSSELASLIEAHRVAFDAFEELCSKEEQASDAFRKTERANEVIVPCLLSGAYSLSLGEDGLRAHIAQRYARQRDNLRELARVDSKAADKLLAKLRDKEAENLALVDRAVEEEEARKEACGLAAVLREYEAGNEAEETALDAICAYIPRTIEEGRVKAEYLAKMHKMTGGLYATHVATLLQSIAGGVLNV